MTPKVVVDVVGVLPHHIDVTWPDGWPPPAFGDYVTVPGTEPGPELFVRVVDWHPVPTENDPPAAEGGPYVYVVLGPNRAHRGMIPETIR